MIAPHKLAPSCCVSAHLEYLQDAYPQPPQAAIAAAQAFCLELEDLLAGSIRRKQCPALGRPGGGLGTSRFKIKPN
ncbi:MAG: hypothetical protein JWP65_1351 [Ramlibacter sp.]|jgi:hypothetical protein|nr:hypothetical protein [Ramlibacter sp.]